MSATQRRRPCSTARIDDAMEPFSVVQGEDSLTVDTTYDSDAPILEALLAVAPTAASRSHWVTQGLDCLRASGQRRPVVERVYWR